jgi:hypothetical protein
MPSLLHSHAAGRLGRGEPVSAGPAPRVGALALPSDVAVRHRPGPLSGWSPAAKWRPASTAAHGAEPAAERSSATAGTIHRAGWARPGAHPSPDGEPMLDVGPIGLRLARGERGRGSMPDGTVPAVPPVGAQATAPPLTLALPPGSPGRRPEPGRTAEVGASPARGSSASPEEPVAPPRPTVPAPGEMRVIADAVYGMIVDRVRRERVARGW